jgi:hypothetical protein
MIASEVYPPFGTGKVRKKSTHLPGFKPGMAACTSACLEDRDFVTQSCEFVGGRKPSHSCTDDGNLLWNSSSFH